MHGWAAYKECVRGMDSKRAWILVGGRGGLHNNQQLPTGYVLGSDDLGLGWPAVLVCLDFLGVSTESPSDLDDLEQFHPPWSLVIRS